MARFDGTKTVEDFGEFNDRNGWWGTVPSVNFLMNLNKLHLKESTDLKTRYIASLTGSVLCGDHTFKVAKVPHANFERVFEAMFAILNEFGQVIGYWMVCSKSLTEIEPELMKVRA